MATMNDDNGEPDAFQTPSRAQELALAVLPIPSAILSILGSSVIIYMSVSTRRIRKWTPYTRLLLCLSFYDIIASVTLGMASFLRNQDTSTRPFSFGTSGTCTMVGFFNQFSYGTLIYNGSLSFYFLLTCRFGYSNAYIARVIEPWMHIIGNGFAVITSVVALALGAYDEMTSGTGCWVANYPRGCEEEGIVCTSRLIGWLYFGLPAISIFILLFIFNSMIFIFVRRHKIPLRLSKPEVEGADRTKTYRDESAGSSSHANDDDEDWNPRRVECVTETNKTNAHRESQNVSQLRDQDRRLRLVSTQAFLYVAFFLLCNVWTGVVGIIESSGRTEEKEFQLLVKYYVFFLLQAVLAPLQGVFNMAVFIRPKLYLCAAAFPSETRLWIVRRTIFGNRVKPTRSLQGPLRDTKGQRGAPVDQMKDKTQKEGARNEPVSTRLPRDMISSVTASEGDFDSEILVPSSTDERWATDKKKGSDSILVSVPIRFESLRNPKSSLLEVISENEASNFEHTSRISIDEELVREMSNRDFSPSNSESRWASDSSDPMSTSSGNGPISIPKREESTIEQPYQSSSFRNLNGSSPASKEPAPDQPIKVPQRRSMPGSPISTGRKALEPELWSSLRQVTETKSEQDEVQLDADKPIKLPVRKKSRVDYDDTFDMLP